VEKRFEVKRERGREGKRQETWKARHATTNIKVTSTPVTNNFLLDFMVKALMTEARTIITIVSRLEH
jgi:hypothetical protein